MNFAGSNHLLVQGSHLQHPPNLQMYPGQFQQQQMNYQYHYGQQWNAQNHYYNPKNWGMPMDAFGNGMNMQSQAGSIGTVINHAIKSEVPSNHLESVENNLENVLPKLKNRGRSDRSEWETDDETLPRNWKKRYFEKYQSSTKSGKVKLFEYLSPSNQIYISRAKMVKHLKEDGRYSSEEINKVEKARVKYNSNQNSVYRVDNLISVAKTIPQGFIPKLNQTSDKQNLMERILKTTTTNSSNSRFSGWETDSFLPIGWKKRSEHTNNKNSKTGMMTKYQYLSPTQEILTSRAKVIENMSISGIYSEDDILQVKKGHGLTGKKRKPVMNKIDESNEKKILKYEANSMNDENQLEKSVDSDLGSSINTTSENSINSLVDFQDSHNNSNRSEKENLLEKLTQVSFTKFKDRKSVPKIANELPLSEDTRATINVLELLPNISILKVNPVVSDISKNDKLLNTYDLVETERSLKNNLNDKISSTKLSENIRKGKERSEWQLEEALPYSWKKRSYESIWNKNGEKLKFTKYEYLSPSEKIFNTRISVITHMEELPSVYSEEQILKFKNSLKRAGRKQRKIETEGKPQLLKEIQFDQDNVSCRTESNEPRTEDNKVNIANLSTNYVADGDESYDRSEKVISLERTSLDLNENNEVDSQNIMDQIESINDHNTKVGIEEEVNIDDNTEEPSTKSTMNNTEESYEDHSSDYDPNDTLELFEESSNDYSYGMVWSNFMNDSEGKFEDYYSDYMIEEVGNNLMNESESLLEISSNSYMKIVNDIEEVSGICMNDSEISENILEVSTIDYMVHNEENLEEFSIKMNESNDDSMINPETEECSIEETNHIITAENTNSEPENLIIPETSLLIKKVTQTNCDSEESGIVLHLIGPSISLEVSDFSMLALLFTKNPNPSPSEIEDISEDMEINSKDVKWTFIKLREKFKTKKGNPVNTESFWGFVELIKNRFGKNTVVF